MEKQGTRANRQTGPWGPGVREELRAQPGTGANTEASRTKARLGGAQRLTGWPFKLNPGKG